MLGEDLIDCRRIFDIARQDQIFEPSDLGKRLDALAEGFALIGEGELGAMRIAARSAMPQAIE